MAEPPQPQASEGAPAKPRRRKALRRAALAVTALGLVAMTALGAASLLGEPGNSIFGQSDRSLRDWAEALRGEGFRVEALGTGPHALDAAEEPSKTLFVVAGVERSYTPGESQAILGFVERGGVALIADDFGFGDTVAEPFGVNFDKRVLRDARFAGNLSLVKVNATAGGRNFTLTANVPSSLGFAPEVQPQRIAESGVDSFIDTNQDGVEDPEDAKGPFTVMAFVPRGRGTAVFVSDPGLLMNGVWRENGPFLQALTRQVLPEGGTVVFDESRHPLGTSGAVLGALLAGEVQATSELPIALALGLGGTVLAALLYASFRPPEDITLHHSRLREPVHRDTADDRQRRLQRLAARAVADANNLGLDAFAAATPQQLAGMAGDPVMAQLVRGDAVRATPAECLERIRAYRAARARREG